MPNYRRAIFPGGTFFFTVVTHKRAPLFNNSLGRSLLGNCLREGQQRWPFEVEAIVLLPDHLHTIWSLPRGDFDFSTRWAWIKKEFTKRWLAAGQTEESVSEGRRRERRRGVWQPRFWEHTLEEEDDYQRHFDYLHFNPVKHGLVKCPFQWPHSSFHRWVQHGVYPRDWACGEDARGPLAFDGLRDSAGEIPLEKNSPVNQAQ